MRALSRFFRAASAAFALVVLPGIASATPAGPTCAGDCDASGQVTVDEIITLIGVALGEDPTSSCAATADLDSSGSITVDELLTTINQALLGCYEIGSCDDPAVVASEPLCALDDATFTCDFLNPEHCLLPYPSSVFLDEDATTDTGYRLAYPREGMPANRYGIHIDPTEHDTLDGFSPGSVILALFPEGVDLVASDVAPITDMERALEEDSPSVLLDADTGERIPHLVELDTQATATETQALIVRPALRLKETHRYIVAFRNLKTADGTVIPARREFRILRDNEETPVQTIEARRPAMEDIFTRLAEHGVPRENLQLAWDFVVAGTDTLTGRLLTARDAALAANGDGAPPFVITSVEEDVDENILRRVRGTFTVPLFMKSAEPPTRYNLGPDGMPVQNGTMEAPFIVNIPRSTVADGVAHPARPCVYGHGLFGDGSEINAGHLRAFSNDINMMFAGTDWIGMSENDVRHVIRMISELSGFAIIPDRLQQAMINFVFLGRLFLAEDGFVSKPEFQLDGQPLIDRGELYYYGISQGGIQGGTYLTISPDISRGVLGAGATNYSFLLRRSIDFAPFQVVLNANYLGDLDRVMLYPLLQQIWDRAEPEGYMSRLLEDPIPGNPEKHVLMQVGINDSQVSHVAAEIQARSLGIPTTAPSAHPVFGIPEVEAPFAGSAYVPYDVGGVAPPLTADPPTVENGVHEAVRRLPAAQMQINAFLRPDGRIENFCDGACTFENVPNVITE